MAQGIILAGGYASRMETNKMLLLLDGKYLIQHVIDRMSPFVNNIIVVTGHYHDDIVQCLQNNTNVFVIRNLYYDLGMFSSVLRGVYQTNDDVFIVPGDYPLIQDSTYQDLLQANGLIRVPVYQGNKGHPLFLERSMVLELQKEPVTSNLKLFRNRHSFTLVDVDDEGILLDVDTAIQYQDLINKKRKENK